VADYGKQQAEAAIHSQISKAENLGKQEAEKLLREQLAKMGVPAGVPFALPTELSAQGVADAAYTTAKNYAEQAIQAETGIPIKLPRKLTAKEIGKSIGALIPTDVEGVIDSALTYGAQAAASAVTTLLAGTAIGSVIPGLGTIVGLAAAIGVQAFKKLLKSPPKPYQRKCKTKWTCPKMPADLDAFGAIAWASDQTVPLSRALAVEQSQHYCGTGPAMDCWTWLSELRAQALRSVQGTVQGMSLPEVIHAIGKLQRAATGYWWFDAGVPGYEHLATYKVKWQPYSGFSQSIDPLLAELRARMAMLINLVQNGERTIEPTRLSITLASEMAKAAVQIQNHQTPENIQWFAKLATMRAGITAREAARIKAMQAEQARGRDVAREKLAGPGGAEAQRRHEEQMAAWLRSERGEAAPAPKPIAPVMRSAPTITMRPPIKSAPVRPPAPASPWPAWFRVAFAAQRASAPVPPPPPIPPVLPPGLPPEWQAWADWTRTAQSSNLPIFPPPPIPLPWAA
jgi:hypothetical protein